MDQEALTDEMWEKIKVLLPPENGYWGRPSRPHRIIVEGILWIHRTGEPWRKLPQKYGPWNSCYNRFVRWNSRGIWKNVWEKLKEEFDDEKALMYEFDLKIHDGIYKLKRNQRNQHNTFAEHLNRRF